MTGRARDFRIEIAQDQLDDLAVRLRNARLPDEETVGDWSQGLPLSVARHMLDYWRDEYDWRRCEVLLNSYPQLMVELDGLDFHVLHVRSAHETARPLLLTHGWPGSIIEFLDVIGPLTDPTAHGGTAADAFHVVLPSLPGYGFSAKPTQSGWTIDRIARAWAELMGVLGYHRWFAQGGDWGGFITSQIGVQAPPGCAGIHVNMAAVGPPPREIRENPTEQERSSLAHFLHYKNKGIGYAEIQRTCPQTLGYALADSPVGQMGWIIEKFGEWAAPGSLPFQTFSIDRLIDNVMLYWLTNSGTSSARLYWESFASIGLDPIDMPSGVSIFPHEITQPSRRWTETRYRNLVHYGMPELGGHFAAMQVPELFVGEVRKAIGAMSL